MADDGITWHRAAAESEITEDEPKAITVGEREIAVYKVGDAFHALHNICPHEYAILSAGFVEGDAIECPLHQSQFHIPTGKCLGPPADGDLATYAVKVEDGAVFVGIPNG